MTQGTGASVSVTNVRADSSTASADDGGKKSESGRLPAVVVYHDIFNLVFIFWLNIANFLFLRTGQHFFLFFYSTMVYFVADLLYVAIVPRSVKSPMVILIHHVITALYLLIPYHYPSYGWCMSYCMLVEINTWLLIAKRTIRLPVVNQLLEAAFYISWVLLRNIFYPYLIYVFYREWQNETRISGTPWNPIGITPIFQVALTGLNYYWTLSLVMKPSKKKQL